MRSLPVLAAAVLGAVPLLAGCGQRAAGAPLSGGSSPPAAGSPSPSAGTRPAGTCHGGPAARLRVLTLTTADNGRSVCVRRGAAVLVYLKGTRASRWSVIRASSAVLQPHASGRLLVPLGVTGASFVAARQGTASLTSIREVCPTPPPNSGSQSGTVECGAILGFRVSVRVG